MQVASYKSQAEKSSALASLTTRQAELTRLVQDSQLTGEAGRAMVNEANHELLSISRTLSACQGKSTAELLKQMYAEADEDGKASLSKAWEEGREKREGKKK